MADHAPNQKLDTLLAHRDDIPDDDFVLQVMQRAQTRRRHRHTILAVCGLLGGGFAAFGAAQLTGPLEQLFSALSATGLMQACLLVSGAFALYAWCMGDDLGVTG